MNFLNPAVLVALAAAAIPVVLHFFNLRKLKTVEFSSLKFLKELRKTKIKRLKLKQLILMILRVLVIVCLVLAFSRPVVEGEFPFFQSYARSSAVILIDNSVSMELTDESGMRFNQAKKTADRIISALSDGSEIALVPLSGASINNSFLFSKDYERMKEIVNNLNLELRPANIADGLTIAESFFAEADNINKEIFIISDFQNNTFSVREGDTLRIENENIGIYPVPIGLNSKTDIKNLSIDSVRIISSIFREDRPVEVEAAIHNHSENDNAGIVVSLLLNNERIAQRSIDIPGNETRNVSIAGIPRTSGAVRAKVQIEGDALEADNERHFGFILPEERATLVIGSKNRYLKAFFEGVETVSGLTRTTYIKPDEVAATNFKDFDALVLSENDYSEGDLERVRKFVKAGGKALIFANDTCDTAVFSEFVDSLGFGNVSKTELTGDAPVIFKSVDKMHPIFENVFADSKDSESEIETPILKKVNLVSGGTQIISMNAGAFLAESRYGEGKSIYVGASTSAGRGNFALSGLFPTILYKSLVYLNSSETSSTEVIVGEEPVVTLPEIFAGTATCKVIDPEGEPAFLNIVGSGNVVGIMPGTEELPGVYTVLDDNEKPAAMYALNPAPSEAYSKIPKGDEIVEELGKHTESERVISLIENSQNVSENIIKARIGTELWKIFALAALLFAIAEMTVARIGTIEE